MHAQLGFDTFVHFQLVMLEANLTANYYLRILKEVWIPFLMQHPDTKLAFERGWLTYQQDGAGAHTADKVRPAIKLFNNKYHLTGKMFSTRSFGTWAAPSMEGSFHEGPGLQ